MADNLATALMYGPGGLPIEQINNTTGTVTYLHHDQAGSTRLITGEKGEVTGAYTYGPYGATEGRTGTATTPLGYDAQYTSPDTGLIYMRARTYDPATAQSLTRDPWVAITGEPYSYVGDNPLTFADPTGRCSAWCVVGVVAGGIALGTGVGEVVIGGGAVAGGVLGGISVVAGAVEQGRMPRNALAEAASHVWALGWESLPPEALALLRSGPSPEQLPQGRRRSVSRRAA